MRVLALGGAPAACFKNVGLPLSIGAQMLAKGQVEAEGVVPPEIAFPAQPFFDELAKRGIRQRRRSKSGVLWPARNY